jgi:DNA-binding NarL/FixJ family response regulator
MTVSGPTRARRSSGTARAWAELRKGRWEAARAGFAQQVAQRRAPDALEGLSWAAWWLDDAETVFEARQAAYALYRQIGRPADAARMATWLAVDQLDFRGAAAVANGWLRRAGRLLDGLPTCPDHGWLAFHEGYVAYGRGDHEAARRDATAAAGIGRRLAVADLEMLGLALEGAVLVAEQELSDGMARLDEATALALEGGAQIPISTAWTCCFMVSACVSVRDYGRASEWCDRIAEFAERYGSRYMLAFCRSEYGAVRLARGRWTDAEAMLTAAHDDFVRSRPAWAGGPLVELAELRRRQGLASEAEALLRAVGASPAALLCRARVFLDQREPRRALELAERVLRRAPAGSLRRFPALEVVVRSRVARGELPAARRAAEALRETERRVSTPLLRAASELAEGIVAAAGGDHERARTLLEDAVDGFGREGAPFEEAQARLELAATLFAAGREAHAQSEVAEAREKLVVLGATGEAERARSLGAEPRVEEVTPREREVLALLARGLTNREIAAQLVVSEHTVHRHVTNILRKLRVPSRAAAAAHAVRAGIAGPA